MVEWTYSSMHVYPRHQIVVSSQLKVSALFPGNVSPVFIGEEVLFLILNFSVGSKWKIQKERDHWKDQDLGGWTILKRFL
jgi:hypothetical protein